MRRSVIAKHFCLADVAIKVYMGSVLMAKKRYVGFKYEHPDEVD